MLQVRAKVITDGHLNPNIVGQSVQNLAKIFEINVPQSAKVRAAGEEGDRRGVVGSRVNQMQQGRRAGRRDRGVCEGAVVAGMREDALRMLAWYSSAVCVGYHVSYACVCLPPLQVLIGEVTDIGKSEPLSEEKLSPILAMFRAPDFHTAVDMADRLIKFGGPGGCERETHVATCCDFGPGQVTHIAHLRLRHRLPDAPRISPHLYEQATPPCCTPTP